MTPQKSSAGATTQASLDLNAIEFAARVKDEQEKKAAKSTETKRR